MKHKNEFIEIISYYGTDAQIDKAIEEMSELITILMHDRRNRTYLQKDYPKAIASEIGDGLNMLEQLMIMYNCEEMVENDRKRKINKTLDHIHSEQENL